MHKKYYLPIAIAHIFITVSLFTPILVTTETKVGQGGETSEILYRMNLLQYIKYDTYATISFFMVLFAIISLAGGIFALVQAFLKNPDPRSPKIVFASGFATAIMGSLQMDSKSSLFFIFCAISFFVISFCSIRLMKMQE